MEIHIYGEIGDKYRKRWKLQQKCEQIREKMIAYVNRRNVIKSRVLRTYNFIIKKKTCAT